MKKKIKDLTLKEVNDICDRAQEKGGCIDNCLFFNMSYKDRINGIATCFCPYESGVNDIGDLSEREVDLDE